MSRAACSTRRPTSDTAAAYGVTYDSSSNTLTLTDTTIAHLEYDGTRDLNIHIGRLASQHTVSTLLPGDTLEDNPYTRYVKEKLNITFTDEIEAGDDDYKNHIALAAASGDIPEMFTVTNYDTLVDLVESDLLCDLTEVYEKYACDYIKGLAGRYVSHCQYLFVGSTGVHQEGSCRQVCRPQSRL